MKNYTDLNIILDRSGSMSSIAKDISGGIEAFLKKEKESGDDTLVSLFQFDNVYDTVFIDKSITEDISIPLNPRGGTALLDAVGRTMTSVGEKLDKLPEDDHPNRVLFLIITDGEENQSREFTFSVIKEKIKHQRETYAWDFVFLGTTEDALFQGEGMGIGKGSSRGFARNTQDINAMFNQVGESFTSYKCLNRQDLSTRAATFEIKDYAADEDNSQLISK